MSLGQKSEKNLLGVGRCLTTYFLASFGLVFNWTSEKKIVSYLLESMAGLNKPVMYPKCWLTRSFDMHLEFEIPFELVKPIISISTMATLCLGFEMV